MNVLCNTTNKIRDYIK